MYFALILSNRLGCFVRNQGWDTSPTAQRPQRAKESGWLASSKLLESSCNFAFCLQGEHSLGRRLTFLPSFNCWLCYWTCCKTFCEALSLHILSHSVFSFRVRFFRKLFLSKFLDSFLASSLHNSSFISRWCHSNTTTTLQHQEQKVQTRARGPTPGTPSNNTSLPGQGQLLAQPPSCV